MFAFRSPMEFFREVPAEKAGMVMRAAEAFAIFAARIVTDGMTESFSEAFPEVCEVFRFETSVLRKVFVGVCKGDEG